MKKRSYTEQTLYRMDIAMDKAVQASVEQARQRRKKSFVSSLKSFFTRKQSE